MNGKAILLGIVAAEAMPILLLVGVVGVYSAVARRSVRPRAHGVLVGGAVGALDFLLVVAKGAPMAPLFVGSALARLAAGFVGAVLAGRAQRQGAA